MCRIYNDLSFRVRPYGYMLSLFQGGNTGSNPVGVARTLSRFGSLPNRFGATPALGAGSVPLSFAPGEAYRFDSSHFHSRQIFKPKPLSRFCRLVPAGCVAH